MALEQPGPWGLDAFTSSRLDPVVGAGLASRATAAGGRALLLRTPGRSRVPPEGPARRRVLVSTGMPVGRPVLLSGFVEDPAEVLDLPWAELAAGSPERTMREFGLQPEPERVFLVCTNAKRDVCCAALGLPLAAALAAQYPDRVFECSHTGGHRFAATGVLLPSGATLGRMTEQLGRAALEAPPHHLGSGIASAAHLRGLSHLEPVLQAADAYARATFGLCDMTVSTEPTLVRDHPGAGSLTHVVAVRTGPEADTPVLLVVTAATDGVDRPVSCGREAAPSTFYDVTRIT